MARTHNLNPYRIKEPLEAHTRVIIEDRLKTLGYHMDENQPDVCNIFRERAKFQYQDDLLKSKDPDFLVYESGTSRILAVIEAKRPSCSLEKAIDQAIELYAKPLDIPIIFVFNSNSFFACTKERKAIKINKIELIDFVDEKTLISLIDNNFEIETVPEGFSLSRADLLKKFKVANNLLRKAGLRDGYERFSVFADLMFLKLKSTFDDIGEVSSHADEAPSWDKLIKKTPKYLKEGFHIEDSEVKSYLEDTIKPRLKRTYGDVFESSLNVADESILIQLIEEIDDIDFTCIDSDVKGDAFEFFLRNVTNGNKDLGEYYTPRHIVKMIVSIINPQYGETVYDPCSGTGGFLLECFRVLSQNSNITINESDTEEEVQAKKEKKRRIKEESIFGREITSTARIAKMNMILFGDGHTNIKQKDCLADPIDQEYDIVVSNIPYSQKVDTGAKYDFPTTLGDSVFMQHIWRAVKKGGRMAVVIPDTFLYSDEEAIAFIRKRILDESRSIVVASLPRGVFNPYTPTKTSVLFAWKKRDNEASMSDVFFYVIRNDGYELGARRRPLPGQSDCSRFLMDYDTNPQLRSDNPPTSVTVNKEAVLKNHYHLFPFDYMEHLPSEAKELSSIGQFIQERVIPFSLDDFANPDEQCAIISITQNGAYLSELLTASELSGLSQRYKRVYAGDFAYNPHRINVGSIAVVPELHQNMFVSIIYPVFHIVADSDLPRYLLLKLLKTKEYREIINDYCLGGARADLKIGQLSRIKINKPSVDEIDRINSLSISLDEAYKQYLSLYQKIMSN